MAGKRKDECNMTMRKAAILLVLCFATLGLGTLGLSALAAGAAKAENFKVGVTTRVFVPQEPYEWRAAQMHGLVVTIWYPARADTVEAPQWFGPPDAPMFSAGSAKPEAAMVPAPEKLPLIVLSHGTGGTGMTMGWLGTALAARGYVAVAVNHPGNNATEPYTVQGFSLWWERARDLSVVIDGMLEDPQFAKRIDAQRIGAAGFSLGGYTMMEIAGGITDWARFAEFCKADFAAPSCKAPEFPDAAQKVAALEQSDAGFREALQQAGRSYRDYRVRAVFAMAPAICHAVTPQSLAAVAIPVEIVAGDSDKVAPSPLNAQYYASNLLNVRLTLFPGGVGHYTFLGACNELGHAKQPVLCDDAPGVDREAVHAKTIALATTFFAANLR
jgi:predicted dienelactone hydrolase